MYVDSSGGPSAKRHSSRRDQQAALVTDGFDELLNEAEQDLRDTDVLLSGAGKPSRRSTAARRLEELSSEDEDLDDVEEEEDKRPARRAGRAGTLNNANISKFDPVGARPVDHH